MRRCPSRAEARHVERPAPAPASGAAPCRSAALGSLKCAGLCSGRHEGRAYRVPHDFRHELSVQRCSERASERLGWLSLSADGLITLVLPRFVGRGGQAGGLGASGPARVATAGRMPVIRMHVVITQCTPTTRQLPICSRMRFPLPLPKLHPLSTPPSGSEAQSCMPAALAIVLYTRHSLRPSPLLPQPSAHAAAAAAAAPRKPARPRRAQLAQSCAVVPAGGRVSTRFASCTDLYAALPTALFSNCVCRASACGVHQRSLRGRVYWADQRHSAWAAGGDHGAAAQPLAGSWTVPPAAP